MSEPSPPAPDNKGADPPQPAGEPPKDPGNAPPGGGDPPESGPDRSKALKGNRPGAIQDRADTRRDAESSFSNAAVEADTVVGRDQHNYFFSATGKAVRIARLPDPERRESEDAFVSPEGFDDLVHRVAAERIVILKADLEQGRYAAARRLMVLDKRPVHVVNPDLDFAALTEDDLVRGGGLICRDLRLEIALEGFQLSRLLPLLEARDARLVITVDTTRVFTDARVAELVHELGRVRDRREILSLQLRAHLGEVVTRRVLDDPGVGDLVDRELAGPGRPDHARFIARQLLAAHREGLPYARTVEKALELRDGTAFRAWFDGSLETLSLQCMAVATAVLGGEPYETVALIALQLKSLLETDNPHQESRPRLDAKLAPTKGRWLKALGAETVPDVRKAMHGGSAPTEVIRYLDQTMQSRVLLHFWSEYDQARVQLLDWLRLCAGHPLESVRTRTAIATGALAVKGFDLVRAVVIEPWCREENPHFRLVAAEALNFAAQQDGLRVTVRELLADWSESEEPELRATAARAWRVAYATGGAKAVFDKLEEYTDDDDPMVVGAVCDSVAEMWEAEWERLDAPIRLLKWISEGKENQKYTAKMAFLLSALALLKRMPGEDFTWPGLLHVAAEDEGRRREIGALWAAVLNDPELNLLAQDVLFDWASRVDSARTPRRSLQRLMWETARTDGLTAQRVRYAALKWADSEHNRTAENSSAEVLKIFQGR